MQVLQTIKFAFNRVRALALALIVLREATFLGVIAAAEFQGFYYTLFQIFAFKGGYSLYFLLGILLFHLVIALIPFLVVWTGSALLRSWLVFVSIYAKLFYYVFFVAMFNYSLGAFFNSSDTLVRVAGLANIPVQIAFLLFHELINESLKFRQADFCNRRIVSYTGALMIPLGLLALQVAGPLYGTVVCLVRAAYQLLILLNYCEYLLPQRLRVFFALFTFYFGVLVLFSYFKIIDSASLSNPTNSLVVMAVGAGSAWMLTGTVVGAIWARMLLQARGSGERGQQQAVDRQQVPSQKIENKIKILAQGFIERQLHLQGKQSYYEHFWQQFNQVVFMHKLRCAKPKCICKSLKKREVELDNNIFVQELLRVLSEGSEALGKDIKLKVLNIYLLVEIARKPLKGYFQLINLKKDKITTRLRLEVEDLVSIARECFDKIYFKNKVQNQQLDLLKVITSEEAIRDLQEMVKNCIAANINFLDIFTYSNVKMTQVETEAARLSGFKKQIEDNLEHLVGDYSEHPSVALTLFVFYKHIEMYRSRESEFKKLAGQQALKKRLLVRAEGEAISEENGIIYIDLVEERGRIRKITRNISTFFGYAREDMLGFNINLFMPTLFGKYHARFLSNFIDKGRIKLLKQRVRVVFGKNKKKYIFPVNVRLKTQHLQQDEFGASALLSPVQTSSEFIIAGKNGRLEEMTEGLYQKLFGRTLRDEIGKLQRFCLYKLIPGLNQILEDWEEKLASKIHEGLIVFTEEEDYLLEKFRHSRESSYASISTKSKSSSISIVSNSNNTIQTTSRSQRYEYFSQIFKSFLTDINPGRLKAHKISYKYSRMKTSEFEVQLIEVISIREQLTGRVYLRELLNEFTILAQTFDLLEAHSPLANNLAALEEEIEKRDTSKKIPEQNQGGLLQLKINSSKENNKDFCLDLSSRDMSMKDDGASQDEFVEGRGEKIIFNVQASDQSSIIGNTENESKRQLLINAFNASDRALPRTVLICASGAALVLLVLLLALSVTYFRGLSTSQALWRDSVYLLRLGSTFQFRVGLAEIIRFGSNLNISLPPALLAEQQQLNSLMAELAQNVGFNTSNSEVSGGVFSFLMPITDPAKNLTYAATFPQAVSQLSQLFFEAAGAQVLRYNYESLHQGFSSFYELRYDYYQASVSQLGQVMTVLLSVYQTLISLVALSSIPIYLYFTRQEASVRGKLAFMSVRQIRKAIGRLLIMQEAFRGSIEKGAVAKFQNELMERKDEKEEDLGGSKIIKLTYEPEGLKLFRKPATYYLLLLFVLFFSNLSLSIFLLARSHAGYFSAAVDANRLLVRLQNKTPLLVNVYLSNLNRALEGTPLHTYQPATLTETETGYFTLLSTLTLPNYTANPIAASVTNATTAPLCALIDCTHDSTQTLQEIAQTFRERFVYWTPNNMITPSNATIAAWVSDNSVAGMLGSVGEVLRLAQWVQSSIDAAFTSYTSWEWSIGIWLSVILIPINALALALILGKYLNEVNQMVHRAEEVFMHFPVSVLVENTYLTSYFNAKTKAGK